MADTPDTPPEPEVPELGPRPVLLTFNWVRDRIVQGKASEENRRKKIAADALDSELRDAYKLAYDEEFPWDIRDATRPQVEAMSQVIADYEATLKPAAPAADLGFVLVDPAPSAPTGEPELAVDDPFAPPAAGPPRRDPDSTPLLDDTAVRPPAEPSAPTSGPVDHEDLVRVVGGLVRASERKVFKGIRPDDIEPDDYPGAPDPFTLLKQARESW